MMKDKIKIIGRKVLNDHLEKGAVKGSIEKDLIAIRNEQITKNTLSMMLYRM